jgi:hypothetical protein
VQSDAINNETRSENEVEDYLMLQKQQSYDNLNISPSPPINVSEDEEEPVIFMFDYFSLPTEVRGLIDAYEDQGKVHRQRMMVKFRKSPSSSIMDNASSLIRTDDDEEEDDIEDDIEDEDENDCPIVYYRDIIIGKSSGEKVNYKSNPVRTIATLITTQSDNKEFTKLIQLASSEDHDGPLLDLKVCLFTEDNEAEEKEFEDMLQSVDEKLGLLESFKRESSVSYSMHVLYVYLPILVTAILAGPHTYSGFTGIV